MQTVSDILNNYVDNRSRVVADGGGVIRRACRPLRRLLGDLPAPIGQGAVDQYTETRTAEKLQAPSIRRELVVLRAAQILHCRKSQLPPPPALSLPPSNRPKMRVLTPDECQRLLWEARDRRLWRYILLGLATGGRRGALLELTWDRINFDDLVVDLNAPHPRAHRRKGRAVVPISKQVADQLRRFVPQDLSERVVAITKDQLHRWFREAATDAGLGLDVTPHTLRHTAATTMIRTVPLLIASRMLGHANTLITESVYIHTAPSDLRPAAEALDILVKRPKRR